ncbi:LolA family protein [Chitinophaga lutea]
MKKLTYILTIICLLCSGTLPAQDKKAAGALVDELQRLQALYNRQPLTFDIKYTYTSEKAPDKVLEEMNGRMAMAGDNFYSVIDSTETIVNRRYRIILFREDRLMYIASMDTARAADPMAQLREVLERVPMAGYDVREDGNVRTLRVAFNPETGYREMLLKVDAQTGYMQSVRYVVQSSMLAEPDENAGGRNVAPGEYSIVTMQFGPPRSLDTTGLFDTHTYFTIVDQEPRVQPAYRDFKIFAGSPNL